MEPPPVPAAASNRFDGKNGAGTSRTSSFSDASDDSQTAADFIDSQLQLEADAREALPYKFDTCTRPLGPLRQLLFACLTCNPPPSVASDPYTPAAVCYSCSVQCHGEHTLVELFNKRNFVCDCGTTRLPSKSPCTLRLNPSTNLKGGVVSESAEVNNKYNHNFQNRFCGCKCDYDAHQQKGTMYQCLGLGTAEEGGCGEDWWHPSCVVGLGSTWYEDQSSLKKDKPKSSGLLETITEVASAVVDNREMETDEYGGAADDDDLPPPPGFPQEDDFEGFICYKCVDANPWIKRYAGTDGFLEPVFKRSAAPSPEAQSELKVNCTDATEANGILAALTKKLPEIGAEGVESEDVGPLPDMDSELDIDPAEIKTTSEAFTAPTVISKKRKAGDDEDEVEGPSKRTKDTDVDLNAASVSYTKACKYEGLPPAPEGTVSLFFKSDFRERFCRCSDCFPRLAKHPQLLEEEETYEPPVSEDGEDADGSTVGSGSLLDRGERALTNVDRVRAIEGVMAYNHLKEKLKPFFQEFAESGKAISAEDIKAHFAKMRGDEEAIKKAGEDATSNSDNRREQSGY